MVKVEEAVYVGLGQNKKRVQFKVSKQNGGESCLVISSSAKKEDVKNALKHYGQITKKREILISIEDLLKIL